MRHRSMGFSLIEFVVVVLIIALLAILAFLAFQAYAKETQITRLIAQYDLAERAIRAEFAKRLSRLTSERAELVAYDAYSLITQLLDPDGRATAPLGGPAYLPGSPDPDRGAIGVSVTSSSGKAGTEVVVLRRPAFLEDVTAASVAIYANSAR